MANGRIKYCMDCMWVLDILEVMSGEDANVLDICIQLWQYGDELDPDNFYSGFSLMLILDSLCIYDERILGLWDVCGRDIEKMAIILLAYQLGLISQQKLTSAIDHNDGRSIDFDAIVKAVKTRLPYLNFKLEV